MSSDLSFGPKCGLNIASPLNQDQRRSTTCVLIFNVQGVVYLTHSHRHFCYHGNSQLKGLQFCSVGLLGASAAECKFYLTSSCLISIFHHVRQIDDNEGLWDERRACAPHTMRSICFLSPVVGEQLIGYALGIDGLPLFSQ